MSIQTLQQNADIYALPEEPKHASPTDGVWQQYFTGRVRWLRLHGIDIGSDLLAKEAKTSVTFDDVLGLFDPCVALSHWDAHACPGALDGFAQVGPNIGYLHEPGEKNMLINNGLDKNNVLINILCVTDWKEVEDSTLATNLEKSRKANIAHFQLMFEGMVRRHVMFESGNPAPATYEECDDLEARDINVWDYAFCMCCGG